MSTATVLVKISDQMSVPASTLALVNNGAQNAYVGEEIVGVVDATDLGNGSYGIGPTLVRGMRGSPTTDHVAGEPFAAAPDVASTTKVEVDPQYVGRRVWVRALSPGQDLDDAPEVSCVIASPTSPYVTKLPSWASGETPSGAADGVNRVFSLLHAPVANSLQLLISGAPTGVPPYTLGGSTITFDSAPASGATLTAQYQYLG